MGKHLKTDNSSPSGGKYNHKSGWLAGMLHVLDFHHWRTKNRPICWKTPRTHSLLRETDEQEPFLEDSKMVSSAVAKSRPTTRQETKLKKPMTTKQVTEYVDFLEILRKDDVFVKILKDPNSALAKQVQIKSNIGALPKSGSFPLPRSPSPSRIEHKQKENWYAPKENSSVLTLNVPSDTSSKELKPSYGLADDHGFNHAVINGFREIKKLLKKAIRDRKHAKTKKKYPPVSIDNTRYSHLFEHSFRREGGELRSRSLKLSNEETNSNNNKPQFFRRISSLSSLEVLGSFLTEQPRENSSRKSIDQDTDFGFKKSLSLSEAQVRNEKEEEKNEKQEERNHDDHLNSINQDQCSCPHINSSEGTIQKEDTLLSQGLCLTSLEISNHEEKIEDAYFCYVNKVLEISGFLENGEKWHSEEQPMNPSLLYELDIQEEEVSKELLFDLVNETITDQSEMYFPKTFSFGYPNKKRFLDEVWGRVEWSLSGLGGDIRDRSLDDIVGRDLLTKRDGWMNLRGESDWITLELEDLIFDDMLDEMLCVYYT